SIPPAQTFLSNGAGIKIQSRTRRHACLILPQCKCCSKGNPSVVHFSLFQGQQASQNDSVCFSFQTARESQDTVTKVDSTGSPPELVGPVPSSERLFFEHCLGNFQGHAHAGRYGALPRDCQGGKFPFRQAVIARGSQSLGSNPIKRNFSQHVF